MVDIYVGLHVVFVWISAFLWDEAELLTHFSSLFHFYNPWKCQKTKGFQGVQNEHRAKLGKGLKESLLFQTVVPFKFMAVFSLTVYMAYLSQNYGFVWSLKVFSWKQIRLHWFSRGMFALQIFMMGVTGR